MVTVFAVDVTVHDSITAELESLSRELGLNDAGQPGSAPSTVDVPDGDLAPSTVDQEADA